MRAASLLLLCWVALIPVARSQTVTTLVNHGDPANRIDLLVVSEGYTAAESAKFTADVNTFVSAFFASEVYKDYATYFNVQSLMIASNQSGASHPELSPPVVKDTVFGAAYNCGGIVRLICVNLSKVTAVVNPLLPANQRDYVFVLVNDATYGGSGGSILVASTNVSAVEIMLHESGHTIALLADEYDSQPPTCNLSVEPTAANATRVTDRATVKWKDWIAVSTPLPTTTTTPAVPGLYLGADYCPTGMYRPTYNSKMRGLGNAFEQINDEQFVRRFYNLVSPIDSASPAATTLTAPQGSIQGFSVTPLAPAAHSLTSTWSLDGAVAAVGTNFSVDTGKLTAGSHTVTVQVHDSTTWVRTDPSNLLSDSQTWQLTVTGGGAPGAAGGDPAFGAGAAQNFAFQFSHPAGYQSLSVVNVLINNALDGRQACYLAYVPSSGSLFLVDDAGDAGGPFAGSLTLGTAGASVQNSQCTVSLSSAVGAGTNLTLTLAVTFKTGFGGNKIVYIAARDSQNNTGWQSVGVWQAPFTPTGTIAVANNNQFRRVGAAGTAQPVTLSLTDTRGAGDIGIVNLLVNNAIDGRQACYIAYIASSNSVVLVDDAGDAGGPFAGSLLLNGSATTIQNSQCMISGAGSSVTRIGNSLTLNLNLTLKTALAGNRIAWMAGRDTLDGNNTNWQAIGTFNVQ